MVWNGYYQFVDEITWANSTTIQLGDTVNWLPLDPPMMTHTITSTSIPVGAASFDQIWELPADTFFQYVPLFVGTYKYECTPHAVSHNMKGTIYVVDTLASVTENYQDIQVYPNPTSEVLSVKEANNFDRFVIFNVDGRQCSAGKLEAEIDISGLSNGHYILILEGIETRHVSFVKK